MSVVNFIAAASAPPSGPPAGDYSLIDEISATADPFYEAGPIVVSRDGSTVFAVGLDGSTIAVWAWRWDGSAWPNLQVIQIGTPGDFTSSAQLQSATLACTEDGARVFLGLPDAASSAGVVYAFDESAADTWTQYQRIVGGSTGRLGAALASDNTGARILIGEPNYPLVDFDAGRAHVYIDGGSSYSIEATLTTTDPYSPKSFGSGACLSGDGSVALVGDATNTTSWGIGVLETHTRSGTTWTYEARAYPADDAFDILGDLFSRGGASPALCMDEAGEHILTCDWAGLAQESVHYVRSGGALTIQSILAGLGGTSVTAGMSMAGDASYVVVGDYGYDSEKGRIHRWAGPTWASDSTIDSATPLVNERHGRGVCTNRDGSIVVWTVTPDSGYAGSYTGDRVFAKVY